MKGLLVKDLRLMKNMKNSILMIILISVCMGAYIKDVSFLVVYLSLIGATFTSSTLSYDEFDNGYAFMFSLPVTRKSYVLEKYGLGLILCGGGWLLGAVISVVAGVVRNTSPVMDSILNALVLLPSAVLIVSVLLPFHMKFGGEKGRIVMIGIMGALIGLFVGVAKLAKSIQIDLDGIFARMSEMGTGAVAAGAIVIATVILLLSCRISMGIMEKKEF